MKDPISGHTTHAQSGLDSVETQAQGNHSSLPPASVPGVIVGDGQLYSHAA